MSISHVDVDGLIVIGQLPLVKMLDKGAINLMDLKFLPIDPKIQSTSVETKNRFKEKSVLFVDTSGGIPFDFVTDLSAEELQFVLLSLISTCGINELGVINGWLCVGADNPTDVRNLMNSTNNSKIFITENVLFHFGRWIDRHLADIFDDKCLSAGLFWFGMHLDANLFFTIFENRVDSDLIFVHTFTWVLKLKA